MTYYDSPNKAQYLKDIIRRIEEEESEIKPSELAYAYLVLGGWYDRNRDHYIPKDSYGPPK